MAALPAASNQAVVDRALYTELCRMCREGHLNELREALYYEKDIHVYFLAAKKGTTLLHEAVECDQADVIQLLLLHGISPNLRARGGLTPLHIAVTKGHMGCVTALLEADADITLKDDFGQDAMMKAERSRRKDQVLRLLYSKELVYLARNGKLQRLEKQLNNSSIRPLVVRDIEQALLVAIQSGHDEAIPQLIVAGARRLDCALYLAIQLERVKAIATLLLCKATITGNSQAIHSLLSEPPDMDSVPWYMPDVHRILTQGGIKMSYPIAVSIMEKQHEATKELLLRTDLDMRRKQVDWSRLKLTTLDASWIYSISPWVVNLKLGNNHLHQLPLELFTAVQLRRLDLSHNLLETVPAEIFAMPNLENLSISRNSLRELPNTSNWTGSLHSLDLSANLLTTLPPGISYSVIEILNLSKNHFMSVPKCLCRVRSLTLLNLSHMPITSLPREMENLDRLVNLDVTNTNIADLQGGGDLRGAIRGFFRARARSNKPCHIVKAVIFCQSDTAKAAMYARLKQQQVISSLPDFEVFSWNYRPLFTKRLFNSPRLTFNTWMLSSQVECFSIFPCLFSISALYVIVHDIMQQGDLREQIKPYLDLLIHHVPPANVLVVTVIPDAADAWVETNLENYRRRLKAFFDTPLYQSLQYHGLLLTASYSIKDQLPDIRHKMYEIASSMTLHRQTIVGKTYPENYYSLIPLLEKEQNSFAAQQKPGVLEEHALWSLFESALASDPPDKMELPIIIDFLQETGFLLHFEDPNDRLDQYYFTRPEWLFETLYKVLRYAFSREHSIILPRDKLCSHIKCSRDFCAALIRLMTHFSIALPITANHFLVPSLLPRSHLSLGQVTVGSLRRQLVPKTCALPVDVWPRLICRVLASLPVLIQQFAGREQHSTATDKGSGRLNDQVREEESDGELFGSPRHLDNALLTSSSSAGSTDLCPLPEGPSPTTPSHHVPSPLSFPLSKSPSEGSLPDPDGLAPPNAPKEIPLVQLPAGSRKKSSSSSALRLVSESPLRSSSFSKSTRPRLGQTATKQHSVSHAEPAMLRRGLQVWDCGIIHKHGGFNFSLYPCHCDMSSVEERGIEICTPHSPTGRALMAKLCRLIQIFFEERYPLLFSPEGCLHRQDLTQLAICPICVERDERSPTSFLIEACVHSLKGRASHNCRYHAEAAPLEDLIPDYLMVDFPQELALSAASFHFCDSRAVQRSQQSSLHQGYLEGTNVTVKVYHTQDTKSIAFPLSHIRQEVEILLQLNHPNIVRLVGLCLQPPCVLTEEALYGTLFSKLMDTEQKIARSVRFHIACQVASALKYLHARSIVYRTLKSTSLLVWSLEFADEVSVKLSNFDRARRMHASGLLGRTNFPCYPAPEMTRYSFREEYTEKVDIYSFSILLYELVTRWLPFGDAQSSEYITHSQRPKLAGMSTASYSPLVKLMQDCWVEDMTLRPSASELLQQLCQPAFHCHIVTQVLRDCLSVRGGCFVPSVRQIWVYGEYNKEVVGGASESALEESEGTQIFILNAENLTVQGSLELKERASCIHTADSKVLVGMTEACVHAYDTATFRFTDRFYLSDSVTSIVVNDSYAFIAQANGHLAYYSKLHFPKLYQTLEVGQQPIISMITVGDDLWLSCGNEIVMVRADDEVSIEKRWPACKEDDQIYTLVLSENGELVWSLVRGSLKITSWDVRTGELVSSTDLTSRLKTVCKELNYDLSYLRLVSLECMADTLWLGLTCGVIVVLTAEKELEIVCQFRAHKKATRCLLGIPQDLAKQEHPVMLSGGFGEVSSLSNAMTLQNGVIMAWQALTAGEFRLLSRRYQRYSQEIS